MRVFLYKLVGWIVFTLIGNWLLRKIPAKLVENAWTGYVDNIIADALGITAPQAATVVSFLWEWGFPAGVAVLAVWLWHVGMVSHLVRQMQTPVEQKSTDSATAAVSAIKDTVPAPRRSIPITPDSMFMFLNGYPIVRETDQLIANNCGLEIDHEGRVPPEMLSKAAQHFGIRTLSDLEELLRESQKTVVQFSYAAKQVGSGGKSATIHRGFSLHTFFEMLAAKTGSTEEYGKYFKAAGLNGSAAGFGEDMIRAYDLIFPPDSAEKSAFALALNVHKIWIQTPRIAAGMIHINIELFNGNGEDIYLKGISGQIRVSEDKPGASARGLGNLATPTLFEARRTHIPAHDEFAFTLAQEVPKNLVERLSNWNDGTEYEFDFGDLNVIVQSTIDPKRSARLPMWDAGSVTKKNDKIVTSKIIKMRPGSQLRGLSQNRVVEK